MVEIFCETQDVPYRIFYTNLSILYRCINLKKLKLIKIINLFLDCGFVSKSLCMARLYKFLSPTAFYLSNGLLYAVYVVGQVGKYLTMMVPPRDRYNVARWRRMTPVSRNGPSKLFPSIHLRKIFIPSISLDRHIFASSLRIELHPMHVLSRCMYTIFDLCADSLNKG